MHEIVEAAQTRRASVARDEAIRLFRDIGEKYKAELIEDLPRDEDVSIYYHGDWHDLCRGPHFRPPPIRRRVQADQDRRRLLARRRRTRSCSASTAPPGATRRSSTRTCIVLEEAERRDHRRIGRTWSCSPSRRSRPAAVSLDPKGW